MLTPKKIIILLMISLILNSCTKIESNNQIDVYKKNNINNKASNHSNAKIITPAPTIDSKLYFRLIENPMRDVVLYSNSGSSFSSLMVGGGGWPPPVTTCGGITVTGTFVTTPPSG